MPRPPQYTDEELLDEIKRLARKTSRAPPLKRDMNKHGKHAARTYQLRFGSWTEAVEAAGFQPRKKGESYTERPDNCPLCMKEESGLDFHHWRYGDNEIGCYFCRDCHDYIHQDNASVENTDWLIHCVNNLVKRDAEYHEPTDADAIIDRYNMPDIGPLVENALSNS